jgi:hypothetical protein
MQVSNQISASSTGLNAQFAAPAGVVLSPAEEKELLDALDEADSAEGISAQELLERLQRFG